jgi:hypothetical protein
MERTAPWWVMGVAVSGLILVLAAGAAWLLDAGSPGWGAVCGVGALLAAVGLGIWPGRLIRRRRAG